MDAMSRDPERAGSQFFGGRVCLDFANTVDWRTSDSPQELIPDFAAFLAWCMRRGILTSSAGLRLQAAAARKPESASRAIRVAWEVRSDICHAAEDLRRGKAVRLGQFNTRLTGVPAQPALISNRQAYAFDLPGVALDELLWPILWSFTAVLTSEDALRIGCCQASGCGWFFVDESPNHTRRWCSSDVCGNRERARRAYAKRRADS
jgi:predicted RNA-binding Zn ribbon-like protein